MRVRGGSECVCLPNGCGSDGGWKEPLPLVVVVVEVRVPACLPACVVMCVWSPHFPW